jgi:DNA-directed RNA polymerase subunit RPC12/RpoP
MATVTCGECGNGTEYDETDASDQVPCTHCNNVIDV